MRRVSHITRRAQAFGVISNPANFLLAGCVVLGSVAAILMFRWWRAEDLDPKFRILLLLLIANVVLVGVAVNVNVWSNHCPQSWADKCVDFNPKTVLPPYPRQVASSLFYNMCLPMCNQGQGYDFNVPPGSTPICRFFNGTGNRR
jgi:hypothetical protein